LTKGWEVLVVDTLNVTVSPKFGVPLPFLSTTRGAREIVPPPPPVVVLLPPPFAANVEPTMRPNVRAVMRPASSTALATCFGRLSRLTSAAGDVSAPQWWPFQNDMDRTSGNPANWLGIPTSPVALRPRLTPSLPLSRPASTPPSIEWPTEQA